MVGLLLAVGIATLLAIILSAGYALVLRELRQINANLEQLESAAFSRRTPSPDDVDHLLKLTRCEFGRDLVSRAVYGDQE